MLLRRFIEHVRAQNWTAVGLDFLIVVMGVFIGVQANGWWEGQLAARKETAYLTALKNDFDDIIAELGSDSDGYASVARAMNFLLEQSRKDAPDASVEELNTAAMQLTFMYGTPIASSTYDNLTGSGDLSIIRNDNIRNALSDFYSQSKVIELVGNTHEMQLVNVFQPYIIHSLDYTGMLSPRAGIEPVDAFDPNLVLTALPTREFRNVVSVKWDIVTDIREVIENSLVSAREVQSLLNEEIAKRE